MKTRDLVVKASGQELWLHHTASSYKVRINAETLSRLEALLAKDGPERMTDDEAFLYRKLSARGMLCADGASGACPNVTVRRASALESIDIEFCGRCNLPCAHCFAAFSNAAMTEETLEKLLAGADELEPVSLVFNGGEPLLNPLYKTAIAAARRRNFRVVVMTNGTLVTSEAAAFLAGCGVAKVVVSLDFFEADHDGLRGPGSFQRTVAGVRRLADQGAPVFITAMAREQNAGQARAFREYCLQELGAQGIRFSAVMPLGRAEGREDLGISEEGLRRLREDGLLGDEAQDRPARTAQAGRFPCTAGVEQLFVAADGAVYSCHYFQNLGEPLGRLSDSSLAEIYRAGLADSAVSRFDAASLDACADCAFLAKCRGGCRARAKLLQGSFYSPDPFSCRLYAAGQCPP